jgi:toxin ParE1/3/4
VNAEKRWGIRLTAAAEADLLGILHWTERQFGKAQERVYSQTLAAAMNDLATNGPGALGAKARDEIGKGLFTLHIARRRRKGRHFVLFRVSRGPADDPILEILRVLHDSMDLPSHIPGGIE